MALICELTICGLTLMIYNVHLESRSNDELRIRQLSEILADIGQRPAEMPVIIGGDFNFDLSRGPAGSLIVGSGLNNPFGFLGEDRTVLKARRGNPEAIDWILTSGSLAVQRPAIHESIAASDHFPLSFQLRILQ